MNASAMCLAPGTVVSVPVSYYGIPVNHVGIVTGCGLDGPSVIHASKQASRQVVETGWRAFLSGQVPGSAPRVLDLRPDVPVDQVLRNARSKLGTPWRLANSNCEHFVRWALGHRKITSPQLVSWTFLALFVGSMALVAYRLIRGK